MRCVGCGANFCGVESVLGNPIVSEEVIEGDVIEIAKNLLGSEEALESPRIKCYSAFSGKLQMGVGEVNFLKRGKKTHKSITHFEVQNLHYLRKDIRNLKLARCITIKPQSADWEEIEIAIEVHCDAGGVTNKECSSAEFGFSAF